jgi:pyroglutamyl-peptidase
MSVAPASPSPPRVEIHLTGFGEFHGVKVNPTQQLATTLPEYLKQHPLPSNVTLASATVVETSGVGAKEALKTLHAAAESAADPPAFRIFLHFGVHAGSDLFKLERFGYNCADFRCADQRGWAPQKQLIEPQCQAAELRTGLDLDSICEALQQCTDEQGNQFVCGISDDPGRFICNYIYFNSLLHVKPQRGCVEHALFVHVPSHDVYDLKAQQRFAREVLIQLAKSLERGVECP